MYSAKKWKVILSLIVSVSLLYVFFKLTKFRDFFDIVDILSRSEIVLLIALSLLGTLMWSLMFYTIYKGQGINIGFFKFLTSFLKGLFAKRTNPLGEFGGEFLVAYIFSRDLKIDYSSSVGVTFSAGVLTAIPSFAFVFFGIAYLLLNFDIGLDRYILFPFVFLSALGVIIYFIITQRRVVERWLGKLYFFVKINPDHAQKSVEKFYSSLDLILKNRSFVFRSIAYSTLAMLEEIVLLYFVFQIFSEPVPLFGLFFIVPVAFLVTHLPLPGGLGGVELSLAAVLHFSIGIPLGVAASAVLIYRVIDFWLPVGIGGAVFGIDFLKRKLRK